MRVPGTSVFTSAGVNMEEHPRPVDLYVENDAAASERGEEPQLRAAVRALLH